MSANTWNVTTTGNRQALIKVVEEMVEVVGSAAPYGLDMDMKSIESS